jgi:hypothetical protein
MTMLTGGGGANDTADQWCAVAMTPLTKYVTADQGASKFEFRLLLEGIFIKKSYMGKSYYIHTKNMRLTKDLFCGRWSH